MADLRKLFEAWAADNHLDAHKAIDGGYFDAQTHAAWFAWQGCARALASGVRAVDGAQPGMWVADLEFRITALVLAAMNHGQAVAGTADTAPTKVVLDAARKSLRRHALDNGVPGTPAHSKSEYKRRVAQGDANVLPPAGVKEDQRG